MHSFGGEMKMDNPRKPTKTLPSSLILMDKDGLAKMFDELKSNPPQKAQNLFEYLNLFSLFPRR
jgi:hypothetical protein